jgi:hypothetical protein
MVWRAQTKVCDEALPLRGAVTSAVVFEVGDAGGVIIFAPKGELTVPRPEPGLVVRQDRN